MLVDTRIIASARNYLHLDFRRCRCPEKRSPTALQATAPPGQFVDHSSPHIPKTFLKQRLFVICMHRTGVRPKKLSRTDAHLGRPHRSSIRAPVSGVKMKSKHPMVYRGPIFSATGIRIIPGNDLCNLQRASQTDHRMYVHCLCDSANVCFKGGGGI